eukprot:TRINITY_DN77617_c0_g1_i1.p2 TRINITY_DN77617_c0_g1~~TRINITY_DN77617_c0_g1_i1.p2  ORF type:complete len:258 (-),score=66.71 TRINITY_DN77617_c0_g1_i1:62-799(-)
MTEGEIDIDDFDGEEEEEEKEEQPEQKMDTKALRAKRLFELRLKANKARAANKTAVLDEYKREKTGNRPDYKKMKQDRKSRKEQFEIDKADDSLNPDKDYLKVTAAQAADLDKKQRKKDKQAAPYGWAVFNQDTFHSSHKKRINRLHKTHHGELLAASEAQKQEEARTGVADTAGASQAGMKRMVEEMEQQQSRRDAFKRRRAVWDEKDVDFINDRNRVYNEKLKRAFDPYTVEIRQNLERGTAL